MTYLTHEKILLICDFNEMCKHIGSEYKNNLIEKCKFIVKNLGSG
jgi:hypothetical protein